MPKCRHHNSLVWLINCKYNFVGKTLEQDPAEWGKNYHETLRVFIQLFKRNHKILG